MQVDDLILFLLSLISIPFYILLLLVFYRFRRKKPFSTAYFKIAASLGVFDVLHLLGNWCLGKFSNWGWLGVSKLVMMRPSFFAKATSVLWWYTAYGQKLGVFFTAFNRMTVIGYNYKWTPKITWLVLTAHWLIPMVLVGPQIPLDYNYVPINGSNGVVMYWKNVEWQWLVFSYCLYYCLVLAALCALCYVVTFWKLIKNKSVNGSSSSANNKKSKSNVSRSKTEIRLAIVGIILTFLTGVCGLYCWYMADVRDPEIWQQMLPYQNVLFDVYAWINPYLLVICSSAVRTHFKAMYTGANVASVEPISLKSTQMQKKPTHVVKIEAF